jgi:hypothetical protein
MSFNKFPPEEKWLWYVEGLKRNPQFRAECDAAVKDFIESEVCYSQDELKECQEKMPDDFGNLLKSPSIIRSFMDYSPQAEILGKRWGLIQAWHYECPDFPPPINYYVAYLKPFKEIKPTIEDSYDARQNPEKYYLDNNGMLHFLINPKAPKQEIMAWVSDELDQFKPCQGRGKDIDPEFPFRVWDLYQEKKNYWKVTCELYPEVAGQDHNYDPEGKRRYEQIKRAYRKADKWIKDVTPA